MEQYEVINSVINFWLAVIYFAILFLIFIKSLFSKDCDAADYAGVIILWVLGTFAMLKLGTFLLILTVFCIPFILLWQLRRYVLKQIEKRERRKYEEQKLK